MIEPAPKCDLFGPSKGDELVTLTITDLTVPPSATPEPSSIALLGTGLLGIAGVVKRRFESSTRTSSAPASVGASIFCVGTAFG
jgi:hypothetical protein